MFWEKSSSCCKKYTVFIFIAQDQWGTSRIGLAYSTDGLHFNKKSTPVFYPDRDAQKDLEWNYRKQEGVPYDLNCKTCYFDGVEDPRIIESDAGTYVIYTVYDGKTARMSSASSKDLIHWTKNGLILSQQKFILSQQRLLKKLNTGCILEIRICLWLLLKI